MRFSKLFRPVERFNITHSASVESVCIASYIGAKRRRFSREFGYQPEFIVEYRNAYADNRIKILKQTLQIYYVERTYHIVIIITSVLSNFNNVLKYKNKNT